VRSTTDRIGSGLEVKGDGSSLILPPGPGRSWDPILDPETPLAPIPKWMVLPDKPVGTSVPRPARPVRLDRYGEAALDNAVRRIVEAPAGAQEITLNAEAYGIGRLAGSGTIPGGLALEALLWATQRLSCHDARRPWRPADLERKVRDSFLDGLRRPREAPRART
jgi:hypothetical protein